VIRALHAAVAVALVLALSAPASAQRRETLTHKVEKGDTLQLLAAEYYGDRRHAVFIMVANDLSHPRPLRPGERVKIPVTRDVTTEVGDSLESLAAEQLGHKERASFLAEFNGLPPDASIAAGQTITVPFHVTHTAAARETIKSIAAAYFGDSKRAEMLARYNFLDSDALSKGESIVIPIFHVRVRESKLPPLDAESKARLGKRREMQKLAAATLGDARAAWREGDYASAKRLLIGVDTDYLDTEQAIDVGLLLGSTYVAFDDDDSALATFSKILERAPGHAISPYDVSPKIREVWKQAGGRVADVPSGE
jgi:LysM repeat protein